MKLMVAVTGGIGAGKSTVSSRLQELGAVLIDSDRLAREVVAPGSAGLAGIAASFGARMVGSDGSLDRAALAEVVFADPAARRRLEAITHPLVRARAGEVAATAPRGSVVVNDIPILVDLSVAATYHLVIGVYAQDEVRIARLVGRGLTEPDARARLAAQISDDLRRPLCDVWLSNDGSTAELTTAVDRLWTERILPFRDGLIAGRSGGGGHRPDGAALERARHRVARALEVPAGSVAVEGDGVRAPSTDRPDRHERLTGAGFPPGPEGLPRSADPALDLTVSLLG